MPTSIDVDEEITTLPQLIELIHSGLDEDTKKSIDMIGGLENLLQNACENAFDMGYEDGFVDAKQIMGEDLN